MNKNYSDEELIRGLRGRETAAIGCLYREFYPVVRHHVFHNSGNEQDVEDVFQDVLLALYKRLTEGELHLTCTLKTYFMSVAKNLWLQRLERKYRLLYQADCTVHEEQAGYRSWDDGSREEEAALERLFHRKLKEIPGDCERLLNLCFLRVPYKEIARLMGFKDENYVKTRKYKCKGILRRRIMRDPECQQYINYELRRDITGMD